MTATKTVPFAKTEFPSIVIAYAVEERPEVVDMIKSAFPRTIIIATTERRGELESRQHGTGGDHQMSWRGYCHTCQQWASGSDGAR